MGNTTQLNISKPMVLLTIMVPIVCLTTISCTPHHHPTAASTTTIPTNPPPLITATLAGDLATVSHLLQQGTDPNLLHNTNTALTYAARDGFTDIAQQLIDHGATVNWIDGEGVTPLILASFKNHPDLVQLLLNHGADTTIKDQWNRTALDYARRRGDTDAIAQLLQSAPDPDKLTDSPDSPDY